MLKLLQKPVVLQCSEANISLRNISLILDPLFLNTETLQFYACLPVIHWPTGFRCTIEMSECVSAVLLSSNAAYVVAVGCSSSVALYDANTAQCVLCIAAEYPAPNNDSLFQMVRAWVIGESLRR